MKPSPITRIIRISRNVVELDRSTAFYQDRLGFQASGPAFIMDRALADELGFGARDINVQRLRLGEEELELVEAGPNARPYPSPNTSADLVFQHLAVRCRNIEIAFKRLYREDSASVFRPLFHAVRMAVRRRFVCPMAAASRPSSFVTRISGHPLELLQPAGDEDARSTVRAGVDHAAISVSSAPSRALHFSSDMLGLTINAYQTNSGSGQGLLDALENPIVDVVSLQTTSELSPHLELLAYRRPIVPQSLTRAIATDIVSDKIVIRCSDLSSWSIFGMPSRHIRPTSEGPILLFKILTVIICWLSNDWRDTISNGYSPHTHDPEPPPGHLGPSKHAGIASFRLYPQAKPKYVDAKQS